MDNQHRLISGYRDLDQSEIDLMNECKELERQIRLYIDKLNMHPMTDKRCVNIAYTNLQQGFMWAIRGVARPTSHS